MGLLNALEEITGDELLHFCEVVDGVGTFGCPVERKSIKKKIEKTKMPKLHIETQTHAVSSFLLANMNRDKTYL